MRIVGGKVLDVKLEIGFYFFQFVIGFVVLSKLFNFWGFWIFWQSENEKVCFIYFIFKVKIILGDVRVFVNCKELYERLLFISEFMWRVFECFSWKEVYFSFKIGVINLNVDMNEQGVRK